MAKNGEIRLNSGSNWKVYGLLTEFNFGYVVKGNKKGREKFLHFFRKNFSRLKFGSNSAHENSRLIENLRLVYELNIIIILIFPVKFVWTVGDCILIFIFTFSD